MNFCKWCEYFNKFYSVPEDRFIYLCTKDSIRKIDYNYITGDKFISNPGLKLCEYKNRDGDCPDFKRKKFLGLF